jgi:AcrR family transcriptional regulator
MARQPTKQRLLEQGVRLFAKKGFRETTVGEIEAAAGLQPRRGALYRHYPSKEALLEAALEQHLQNLAVSGAEIEQLIEGDIRAQALTFGRWLLDELDREEAIMRILEQDGDRLPRLRMRFRQTLVDPGYALITHIAHEWLGPSADGHDIDALSAVLLGGLINYRRSTWTFRAPPAGLDEERFLASWADVCRLGVEALSKRTRTSPSRRRRAKR